MAKNENKWNDGSGWWNSAWWYSNGIRRKFNYIAMVPKNASTKRALVELELEISVYIRHSYFIIISLFSAKWIRNMVIYLSWFPSSSSSSV